METSVYLRPQVAGKLRTPITMPLAWSEGIQTTYHWEAEDDRSIFVHLKLAKVDGSDFYVARTNIDSAEVRGQGEALWSFIGATLQEYSDAGVGKSGPTPIIHAVHANEYSQRLPETDPRYTPTVDDYTYQGIYLPVAPASIAALAAGL